MLTGDCAPNTMGTIEPEKSKSIEMICHLAEKRPRTPSGKRRSHKQVKIRGVAGAVDSSYNLGYNPGRKAFD